MQYYPKHYCGVFGIYGHPNAAQLTYYGLYALQHRGQESAGIVTSDGKRFCEHRGMGLVSQIFHGEALKGLHGTTAIGHTRYSTTGSSHLRNAQPLTGNCRLGQIAIARLDDRLIVLQYRPPHRCPSISVNIPGIAIRIQRRNSNRFAWRSIAISRENPSRDNPCKDSHNNPRNNPNNNQTRQIARAVNHNNARGCNPPARNVLVGCGPIAKCNSSRSNNKRK